MRTEPSRTAERQVVSPSHTWTIASMRATRFLRWLFILPPVQSFLKQRVERNVKGPSEARRAKERTLLWGEVESPSGRKTTMRIITPEGYTLTAESAVLAVERLLAGSVAPGAWTPARAFGPGFLRELSGVEILFER